MAAKTYNSPQSQYLKDKKRVGICWENSGEILTRVHSSHMVEDRVFRDARELVLL